MIAAFLWIGLIAFVLRIAARVWFDCTKPLHQNRKTDVDQ